MRKMNKEKRKKLKHTILETIEKIAYIIVLIPLSIITILIAWQLIFYPEKIPDIFGYKIFMIFDEYMDESVRYGDLVFTKNINPEVLKPNQVVAFRNGSNTVTIHKIVDIETKEENYKTVRNFTMNTLPNETVDTKFVKDSRIEGILVHRIPKLGAIIFFLQQPIVVLVVELSLLFIGLVWIYIAGKLDERDLQKIKAESNV